MAGELKTAEHDLAHQMADMKAVRGGIEATVERDRAGVRPLRKLGPIGAIRHQAPPV